MTERYIVLNISSFKIKTFSILNVNKISFSELLQSPIQVKQTTFINLH